MKRSLSFDCLEFRLALDGDTSDGPPQTMDQTPLTPPPPPPGPTALDVMIQAFDPVIPYDPYGIADWLDSIDNPPPMPNGMDAFAPDPDAIPPAPTTAVSPF